MQRPDIQKRQYPIPPELTDVIPGYLARRDQDILDLKAAIEIHDFIKIESIGHKLKGNGASFGFDKLTEIGSELMALSHQLKIAEIKIVIQDFETEVLQIRFNIC